MPTDFHPYSNRKFQTLHQSFKAWNSLFCYVWTKRVIWNRTTINSIKHAYEYVAVVPATLLSIFSMLYWWALRDRVRRYLKYRLMWITGLVTIWIRVGINLGILFSSSVLDGFVVVYDTGGGGPRHDLFWLVLIMTNWKFWLGLVKIKNLVKISQKWFLNATNLSHFSRNFSQNFHLFLA